MFSPEFHKKPSVVTLYNDFEKSPILLTWSFQKGIGLSSCCVGILTLHWGNPLVVVAVYEYDAIYVDMREIKRDKGVSKSFFLLKRSLIDTPFFRRDISSSENRKSNCTHSLELQTPSWRISNRSIPRKGVAVLCCAVAVGAI